MFNINNYINIYSTILNFNNGNIIEKSFFPILSIKEVFFICFLSFLFLTGLVIILSRDVIYSLLGLIFLYVLCSIIVLSYYLEFLAFALVIVSLGAVAVLFLSVVLMVNQKGHTIQESIFYKFNVSSFFLSISFLLVTVYITGGDIKSLRLLNETYESTDEAGLPVNDYVNVYDILFSLHNTPLKLYGIILYDKYFLLFVLIGIILLVALIGCILLTYDGVGKKKNKVHFNKNNIKVGNNKSFKTSSFVKIYKLYCNTRFNLNFKIIDFFFSIILLNAKGFKVHPSKSFKRSKFIFNYKFLFIFLKLTHDILNKLNNRFKMNSKHFFNNRKSLLKFLIYYKYSLFSIFLNDKNNSFSNSLKYILFERYLIYSTFYFLDLYLKEKKKA